MKSTQLCTHKHQERIIIDHFRSLFADFPQGILISSESPDFVLRRKKGSRIGIELTSIKAIEGSGNTGRIISSLSFILEKKNEKALLYRRHRFVELWLIIAVDYIDWPQSESPNDFLIRHGISSQFKRIFLFDLFGGNIYELN